jgi:hypothetical protein
VTKHQDSTVDPRGREAVAVFSFTACLPDDEAPCGCEMIDRFADLNAGHRARRNTASQQAVRMTSGAGGHHRPAVCP